MTIYNSLRRTFPAILLFILLGSCRNGISRDTEPTKTPAQNLSSKNSEQPISYGELVIKPESDYLMIPIIASGNRNQSRGNILGSSYYETSTTLSNIIFYRKKDGESHLLLNKKAIITSFDSLEQKGSGKPPKRFLLYRMIENDTNEDKKLTAEDAAIGYLSDLSGKNLQQITPNNSQLLSWSVVQSVGAVFVKIVKDSDNDKKFTERDETTFIKVSLDKPSIGTEIISDKIEQQIKSLNQE